MNSAQHIAQHIRQLHLGGNWTDVCVRDVLDDVTLIEALQKVSDMHTIAELCYHMNYFVAAQRRVFEGKELNAHDKFSFDVPMMSDEADWQALKTKCLKDAQALADIVETLSPAQLDQDFVDARYGSNFRNLLGLLEHTHYHLGQVVMMKRIVKNLM